MNDFESQVMQHLIQIKSDLAANTEATLALSGPTGRVTVLERAVERAETRQWIHSTAIIPVVTALHAIARKLGLTL